MPVAAESYGSMWKEASLFGSPLYHAWQIVDGSATRASACELIASLSSCTTILQFLMHRFIF